MVYMPHWPLPLGSRRIDLGLTRVHALLGELGNPHLRIENVIHVAGTNGKGSTIAFLKAILQKSGFTVNTYTSPHLMKFNERIVLNKNEISDDFLYEVCEETRIAAEKASIEPTFFEGTTVAAFLAFAKKPADFLILETGMGGRLDATNIFDKPLITIITTIGLDHQNFLGGTLPQIAYEKAGIIKAGTPCVIANQDHDVSTVLFYMCEKLSSKSYAFEYDFIVREEDGNIKYSSQIKDIDQLQPSLLGKHQYVNLASAITAALLINSPQITTKSIQEGVMSTKWMGRLQKLLDGKIVNQYGHKHEIWVDGAHNQLGSHVLALWISEQTKPVYLIVGITNGRNITDLVSPFIGLVHFIAGVNVHSEPNSYKAEEVTAGVQQNGFDSIAFYSATDAIKHITENFPPGIIMACGSLYLAGEILFENQFLRA